MKKHSIQLVSSILLASAIFMSGCSKDEAEEGPVEVKIADTRLESSIRQRLKLSATEVLTETHMQQLDTLNLDASATLSLSELSNLSGLEHATNLLYLHVGNTSVTSLEPIKNLKKVKYLRINNTSIADLSPVAGYTTLTYFNANTARSITDISSLAGNTGLKEIILRDVPFGNAGMETIKKFTGLYRINMRSTGVTDISGLVELMNKGALLDTTPGAAEAGGADLDLRGLSEIDCSVLEPFKAKISNLEGC